MPFNHLGHATTEECSAPGEGLALGCRSSAGLRLSGHHAAWWHELRALGGFVLLEEVSSETLDHIVWIPLSLPPPCVVNCVVNIYERCYACFMMLDIM